MILFIKLDNYWAKYIPYAFLHMGYHLKKNNINYDILHNLYSSQLNTDKKYFIKRIAELNPKIIGFSVITGRQSRDSAVFSQEIKRIFPHIKILWGGIHPTILPKQCIEQPYIDYVLQGEADSSIVKFYEQFRDEKDFSKVAGCWWKDENIIKSSNIPLQKPEPDQIGLDFDKIDLKRYFDDKNGVSFITSRGCPFTCQFCVVQSLGLNKIRFFPTDFVKETLQFYKSKGIKRIHFNDDNFYLKFDRAISILEFSDMPSFSEIRIPTILKDKSRLKLLEELQCKTLMSGGESCDNEILEKIQKKQTYEQLIEAAHLFKNHPNVTPSWSFIVGMPIENVKNIKKTVEGKKYLESILGRNIGPLGFYMPYPGSPMYNIALTKGFVEPKNPLEWGVFERYGISRKLPPEHNAFPWIEDINEIRNLVYGKSWSRNFYKIHLANILRQNYHDFKSILRNEKGN